MSAVGAGPNVYTVGGEVGEVGHVFTRPLDSPSHSDSALRCLCESDYGDLCANTDSSQWHSIWWCGAVFGNTIT